MTTSDAAKAHHDHLFGERISALAETDPEFIAYFDNFAFDEILTDATSLDESVDLHTGLLVQLAAVLAAGGLAEFRVLANAALTNAGVSPIELKELVYHAVAYVGLAHVYRAGGVISRVGVPQYDQGPIGWAFFGKNTTLTGGPAPVRAYIEQLLPAVLDGSVNPGKVFDRTVSIEDTPQAYAAMDARQALKVMIKP